MSITISASATSDLLQSVSTETSHRNGEINYQAAPERRLIQSGSLLVPRDVVSLCSSRDDETTLVEGTGGRESPFRTGAQRLSSSPTQPASATGEIASHGQNPILSLVYEQHSHGQPLVAMETVAAPDRVPEGVMTAVPFVQTQGHHNLGHDTLDHNLHNHLSSSSHSNAPTTLSSSSLFYRSHIQPHLDTPEPDPDDDLHAGLDLHTPWDRSDTLGEFEYALLSRATALGAGAVQRGEDDYLDDDFYEPHDEWWNTPINVADEYGRQDWTYDAHFLRHARPRNPLYHAVAEGYTSGKKLVAQGAGAVRDAAMGSGAYVRGFWMGGKNANRPINPSPLPLLPTKPPNPFPVPPSSHFPRIHLPTIHIPANLRWRDWWEAFWSHLLFTTTTSSVSSSNPKLTSRPAVPPSERIYAFPYPTTYVTDAVCDTCSDTADGAFTSGGAHEHDHHRPALGDSLLYLHRAPVESAEAVSSSEDPEDSTLSAQLAHTRAQFARVVAATVTVSAMLAAAVMGEGWFGVARRLGMVVRRMGEVKRGFEGWKGDDREVDGGWEAEVVVDGAEGDGWVVVISKNVEAPSVKMEMGGALEEGIADAMGVTRPEEASALELEQHRQIPEMKPSIAESVPCISVKVEGGQGAVLSETQQCGGEREVEGRMEEVECI
ncbi:hypothetical protein HDU93_008853 [Gonapodya sp. JEL0774]|nr:hypothetical protein HDU93_008853 [Gonapodya sp. JEL0774]